MQYFQNELIISQKFDPVFFSCPCSNDVISIVSRCNLSEVMSSVEVSSVVSAKYPDTNHGHPHPNPPPTKTKKIDET
jgi:hypothetical protein